MIKKWLFRRLVSFLKMFHIECRLELPKYSTRQIKYHMGNKKLVGAEIGVWLGENAESILKNLNMKKLYLIDPYKIYDEYNIKEVPRETDLDKAFDDAQDRLSEYKNKIKWVKKKSEDAVNDLPMLDFVYIDGNHDYKYVKQDMNLYWNKIKSGGILAGHDIDKPEILQALAEFIIEHNLKAKKFYRDSDFSLDFLDWVIRKPENSHISSKVSKRTIFSLEGNGCGKEVCKLDLSNPLPYIQGENI